MLSVFQVDDYGAALVFGFDQAFFEQCSFALLSVKNPEFTSE